MKRYENVICVDDKFTGTTKEVIEYLGFGTPSQICRCVNEGRLFRGHKLELKGILKHVMIYTAIYEDEIIATGTGKELSEQLGISESWISANADKDKLVCGMYKFIRVGMSDRLEK